MSILGGEPAARVVSTVLGWYGREARDLPWRRPDAGAWAIMVSEFMLQQTPVSRVLVPWTQWMDRWPTPADLAGDPVGEAIRAWGRLGYPRRAIRLHAAATVITERFAGEVPRTYAELRTLPGVGDYTAAAIASFAYRQRHVVLDTNVRRLFARLVLGEQYPGRSPAVERSVAERLLPRTRTRAATWAVASMELGALVCTARSPRCESCPVVRQCAWHAADRPAWDGPPRRGQAWAGTDRQCRGALMACVRDADGPVGVDVLARVWAADAGQRERAIDGLVSDGLLVESAPAEFTLPR